MVMFPVSKIIVHNVTFSVRLSIVLCQSMYSALLWRDNNYKSQINLIRIRNMEPSMCDAFILEVTITSRILDTKCPGWDLCNFLLSFRENSGKVLRNRRRSLPSYFWSPLCTFTLPFNSLIKSASKVKYTKHKRPSNRLTSSTFPWTFIISSFRRVCRGCHKC